MDLKIKLSTFRNMCRICLQSEHASQMTEIFATTVNALNIELCELFTSFTRLHLEQIVDFPTLICTNCQDTLIAAYEFQLKCIKADHDIRMALGYTLERSTFEDKFDTNCIFVNESSFSDELVADRKIKEEHDFNFYSSETIESFVPEQPIVEIKENSTSFEGLSADDNTDSDYNVPAANKRKIDKTKKNIFTCSVCDKFFDRPSHLLRHSKMHNIVGKPFECTVCKRRFARETEMIAHQDRHNLQIKKEENKCETSKVKSKKSKICKICDKSFNKPSLLIRHSNVHNPEGKPFECKICKKRFTLENTLIRHEFTHSMDLRDESRPPKREYACVYCRKKFHEFQNLKRHIKTHDHDVDKTRRCSLCEKTFSVASMLIDHMNCAHKGQKPYICSICNKGYYHLHALKNHARIHTGETPYLCSECGKTFNDGGGLNQHMRYHAKIKPFQCSECPNRFHSRGILKCHMLTHTGIKPYTCETCGSTFTKGSSLKKHIRIHTGERPYACTVCDRKFNSSGHVIRHMRIHTGEKPYHCEYCDRSFAQKGDLNKHTRSHIGENTYQCKECPAAYRLLSDLKKHIQDHYLQKLHNSTNIETTNEPVN